MKSMTINSRLKITFKLMLVFAFVLIVTNPNVSDAKDKKKKYKPGTLTWGIPDTQVISYASRNYRHHPDLEVEELYNKGKYNATIYKPARMSFYGYQFDEEGKLIHELHNWGITGTYPYSITDLIEQICFYLPGDKARKNKKYEFTKTFYLGSPQSAVEVIGYWEIDDVPKDVNKKLIIKGSFALKEVEKDSNDKFQPKRPKKLEEGLITTETTFNQELGYIEKVTVNYRYWYEWKEPTDENQPKYNRDGRWESFEFYKADTMDIAGRSDLKSHVTRAINMAVEAIKQRQQPNGSWNYSANHIAGSTSISALALLSAGVKKDDECINRAFNFLYQTPITNTYDASLVCMAVEARGIPESEWKLANEIKTPEKFERDLNEQDRKLLKTALDFLLKNRAKPHPRTKIGLWDYPTENPNGNGTRFDNSNSQFAVLGLYSALRCGEKIDKKVFIDIANQFMITQEPDGPEISLMLPKEEWKRKTKPSYHKYAIKARGWGYTVTPKRANYNLSQSMSNAYGSMTAAGVTSMAIARAGLINLDQLNSEMKIKIKNSLNCAMAFFQTYYDITGNPKVGSRRNWYYYYLYGIERVGMLMGTEYIGEHEWYPEGAAILVMEQNKDGSWDGNISETAFALLFLKRATLPVITGS